MRGTGTEIRRLVKLCVAILYGSRVDDFLIGRDRYCVCFLGVQAVEYMLSPEYFDRIDLE